MSLSVVVQLSAAKASFAISALYSRTLAFQLFWQPPLQHPSPGAEISYRRHSICPRVIVSTRPRVLPEGGSRPRALTGGAARSCPRQPEVARESAGALRGTFTAGAAGWLAACRARRARASCTPSAASESTSLTSAKGAGLLVFGVGAGPSPSAGAFGRLAACRARRARACSLPSAAASTSLTSTKSAGLLFAVGVGPPPSELLSSLTGAKTNFR